MKLSSLWGRFPPDVGSLGNPQDVLRAIADRHKLEPTGEPSLQNAIEMARSTMRCVPVLARSRISVADVLQSSTDTLLSRDPYSLRLVNYMRPR